MAPSLTLVAQTKMARYSIGMQETTKGWEKSFQLILGLGLTALFFFMMAPFMVAILFAAVITIVAYPLYSKLRRSLPPPAAAILITLGITLGVLIPLAFLLVGGAYQVLAWVRTFPAPTVENFQSLVERFHLQKLLNFASPYVSLDMNWLQSNAMGILEGTLTRISQFSTGFISGIPSLFLGVSVVIVGIYFFLVDGSKLLLFLAKVSPMKPERSRDLYLSFEKSCRGVVLAMLVSCLIQAILVFMFFILTGVPNAPLFGLSSFIMGMVPVVGVAPITLGASLYLFLNGEFIPAIVMTVAAVFISTSDNFIRPWVMKGQSEMHPMLALVSAFGAVQLLGATGIFLGPIIAAVFVSFLNILAQKNK